MSGALTRTQAPGCHFSCSEHCGPLGSEHCWCMVEFSTDQASSQQKGGWERPLLVRSQGCRRLGTVGPSGDCAGEGVCGVSRAGSLQTLAQARHQPQGLTGSPERYLTWAIAYSGSIRAGATLTTGFKIAATCLRRGDTSCPGGRGCRNTRVWLCGLAYSKKKTPGALRKNTLCEGILFHMQFTFSYFFIFTLVTLLIFIYFILLYSTSMGFPGSSYGKESACNAGDPGSVPWVRKTPWRREWQPTPVFL